MRKAELIFTVIQLPLDYLMLLLAGLAAYSLRFTKFFTTLRPVIFDLTLKRYLPLVFGVAAAWLLLFIFSGLYRINPNRKLADDLTRVFFACSTGLAAITIFIFFRGELFNSRFIVLAGWALAIAFVSAEKTLLRLVKVLFYRAGLGNRQVVVIGSGRTDQIICRTLVNNKNLGFRVAAHFDQFDDQTLSQIKELLNRQTVEEIIFTNPQASQLETLKILDFCDSRNITFKYTADFLATLVPNMTVSALAGVPIIEMRRTPLAGWGRIYKQALDLLGASFLIVIASPLMLAAALAIALESGRPIIYKNERLGEGGRKFFALKFRSMRQPYCTGAQFGNSPEALAYEEKLIAEKNSKEGPVYKIKDDPRITPVGRWLRRASLDELPQFFNVLRGEMSLVGPRPHQPREVAKYREGQHRVLNIKPGITGPAQIYGRSDLQFEEEARLDAFYIENWSMLADLIILLKTPFTLFRKRKAL